VRTEKEKKKTKREKKKTNKEYNKAWEHIRLQMSETMKFETKRKRWNKWLF
jgi:hypothetical protein